MDLKLQCRDDGSEGAAQDQNQGVFMGRRSTPKKNKKRNPDLISQQSITSAFSGSFSKPKVDKSYLASLLLVSILMLCLPLIYICITATVGYATYYYATEYISILNDRGVLILRLVQYGVPVLSGLIFFTFLLRPFIPTGRYREPVLTITEKSEPNFVHFIYAVCDSVGAKRPEEIHISMEANASASLKGFQSLFNNKLVLNVGFALMTCMNTRELAGVLAHEFGHFSQRMSMRCYYLTHVVNGWLYECVYNKDGWNDLIDDLDEQVDNGIISLAVMLARGGIFITNQLLSFLMMISHLLTQSLSRKMEFDADCYEALVAGSAQFSETTKTLHRSGAATMMAFDQIYEQQQFFDNLPALIASHYHSLDGDIDKNIQQQIITERANKWDSHPPDKDRIASARAVNAEGIFKLEQPVNNLFNDFDDLAKRATQHFYRSRGYFPTLDELKTVESAVQTKVANFTPKSPLLEEFTHSWFNPDQVWAIPSIDKLCALSNKEKVAHAQQAISKLRASIPENNQLITGIATVKEAYSEWVLAERIERFGGGMHVPPSFNNVVSWREKVSADYNKSQTSLQQMNVFFGRRVGCVALMLKNEKQQAVIKQLLMSMQQLKRIETVLIDAQYLSRFIHSVIAKRQQGMQGGNETLSESSAELATLNSDIAVVLSKLPKGILSDEASSVFIGKVLSKAGNTEDDDHLQSLNQFHALQGCFYKANTEFSTRLAKIVIPLEKQLGIKPIKMFKVSESAEA